MMAVRPQTIETLVGVHGDEQYIVRFGKGQYGEVVLTLGRWACNPELSLTWRDATQMLCRLVAAHRNEVFAEMKEAG